MHRHTWIAGVESDARTYASSAHDPTLMSLLQQERERQMATLTMVASSSIADPSVLECTGAAIGNLTTEGYPGARYHGGCSIADAIESLAISRAKALFGARYANVQPHSCTSANQAVMFALLAAGDRIMGMDLKSGGHLTHGAKASCSGKYFASMGYGLDSSGTIDYDEVARLAKRHQPKMIICGASAYPRSLDFVAFRRIADSVDAILLADISHIAGLVASGLHASPVDVAHITTTSTYKQLFGPRGGLILLGNDAAGSTRFGGQSLEQIVQKSVFPFFQGTPDLASIAAKARALDLAARPAFVDLCKRITRCASTLAASLSDQGYELSTGGTDNHMVLVSLRRTHLTGVIAERALEDCGIVVNKNVMPGEERSPLICSGIRLGTNTLAYRGMDGIEMNECARLIHTVLSAVQIESDTQYILPASVRREVHAKVMALCRAFPIPGYSVN